RVNALLRDEVAAPARPRPAPRGETTVPVLAPVKKIPRWPLALGAVVLAGAGMFFTTRPNQSAPPSVAAAKNSAAPAAVPAAEFPHDPDLKRAFHLINDVVGGIAEDFALADDLVK